MTARGFTLAFTPESGPRRRIRFEPRGDAPAGPHGPAFWRIEEEFTGCRWRTLGRESVKAIALERERELTADSA